MRKIKLKKYLMGILWQLDNPVTHLDDHSIHVDLGSGANPRNPFNAQKVLATDFHETFTNSQGIEYVQADLTKKLPFATGSINSFSAYDVLEHIPRWERDVDTIHFPFIDLMSEIYRCLSPGGIFLAVTPGFPSAAAFQDPTHINFITEQTVNYFVGKEPWAASLGYGFKGNFELVHAGWLRGSGPMSQNSLVQQILDGTNIAKLVAVLKFAKRYLSSLRINHPTHIVWVLRKSN
jgi:SAM-dependent methyltransferase